MKTTRATLDAELLEVFPGTSEMADRMRSFDWSETPLGPVHSWPSSLKTAVGIVLQSRYPMFIWWGRDEVTSLYNDAYIPVLGDKHPAALGRSGCDVWSEIWDDIGPLTSVVFDEGRATWSEEFPLTMLRRGYLEETFFTFSYSPIVDRPGNVAGLFCACTEDTQRVVSRRRLKTQRAVAGEMAAARDVDQACLQVAKHLETNPHDLPFVLLYLFDQDDRTARLTACAMLPGDSRAVERVDLSSGIDPWNFASVLASGKSRLVEDFGGAFSGPIPSGSWSESPTSALVVPLTRSGYRIPTGCVVFGISPRREFDDDYRDFCELVAGHIATGIVHARAYTDERQRADALAELDRAKSTFFSNVSHEFRTPLTLMLAPLEESLARGSLSVRDRESLGIAHRNSVRLLKLVNTLLDFSRIEAGRTDMVYEETDVGTFTRELVSMFRAAIESAGLYLEIDAPPDLRPVWLDVAMWEKIVLNLLSNAFKFTLRGGISVALRQDGDTIELHVRDTGSGIPKAELPEIFKRFHRVRAAEARTHEGTGIGLALVQELVKLHSGSISVESEVGIGTTFVVRVRAGRQHRSVGSRNVTRTPSAVAPTAEAYVQEAWSWLPRDIQPGTNDGVESVDIDVSLAGARIVLADDNRDMREYLDRLLSAHWTVEPVADGQAALDAIRTEPPDLVIADVMMPKKDGFEVLKGIRDNPATSLIPVILLSARAGEEARIDGIDAGADDYLTKPFSARELIARVNTHLQLSRIRKEAHRRVTESEERYRSLVDASSAVVWRATPDGDVLDAPKWPAMTGTPEAMLKGRQWLELVHPEDRAATGERWEKCITEQTAGRVDYRLRVTSGEYRWVSARAVPVIDSSGTLKEWVGTVSDIHVEREAKRAVAALNEQLATSVRDLQAVLETAPVGIWFARDAAGDRDCGVIEGNRTANRLLGLPGEYTGPNAPVKGRDSHGTPISFPDSPLQQATGTRSAVLDEEYEIDLEDGRSTSVLVSAVPLLATDGTVRGSVAAAVDITDRKRAEQTLAESEQRFRNMADNAPVMVWVSEPDGRCSYLSRSWYEYTGQTPQTGLGFGWLTATHPDDAERSEAEVRHANERRQAFTLEYRLRGVDGNYRWFVDSAMPRLGDDGSFLGYIGSVFDIDDRKSSEAEREQLLADTQRARADAETANRGKDEFLAVLSHELRSPMNAMLGWLRILKTAGARDPDLVAKAVDTIERNVWVQAQVINDLLDVSRIMSGKLELEKNRVDVYSMVAGCVESLRPSAEGKQVALRLVASDGDAEIMGDSARMQQVVANLIGNAIKFTNTGGFITVSANASEADVRITVEDTGLGIEPEFLPHLFERFRQANSSSSRKYGGLGLGLAIVKNVVELHGGKVEATSGGPGLGACFVVTLPRAPKQTAVAFPAMEELHPRDTGLLPTDVLLVEDDDDSRQALELALEEMGARVRTAASVRQALEEYGVRPPDVVISDIGMPDQDGYVLIREIREREEGRQRRTLAIAMTGFAGRQDREMALRAGFDEHVAKPVEPDALIERVRVLEASRTSGRSPKQPGV